MEENGSLIYRSTKCSTEYLGKGRKLMEEASYCVGGYYGGVVASASYTKMSLYACRLYNRILDSTEVERNFNESINYRKYLMEN